MAEIELTDVYKIFGPAPEKALDLARGGRSRDQVLAETGNVVALSGVNLAMERSEVTAVIGLSGSGKSTLIRLINGLIRPTAGTVRVGGEDIVAMDEARLRAFRCTRASMVFQGFGLFPHKRVLDNVAFGLEARGEDKAGRLRTARRWIDAVGLAGFEDSFPAELSGGMRQRVGLARALATDADILLMDEPFSALDPLTRADMQDLLAGLQSDLKKTVVLITHDLDEARRLAGRIAILKDGELRQTGTPEEIMERPADDYVRRFVETVNR